MPYKIRKRKNEWCVVKKDDPDGDSLGCHPSPEEAKKQLAALYANEPMAQMGLTQHTEVAMAKTERSFDDVRSLLQSALVSTYGLNADGRPNHDCYVRDVYPTYFIYSEGYGPSSTYKRTYSISSDGVVTLGDPQKVVQKTVYEPVKVAATYSVATFGATTNWVIKEGKLFEAGFFPDKNFDLLPDELESAVARWQVAGGATPVDIEHIPTVLSGKLGHVQDVWVGEDGISLFGKVAIPTWLDTAMDGEELRVSATWDRTTKDLVGLALVLNPRITDAAVMAAFTTAEQGKHPATQPTQPKAGKTGGSFMGTAFDMVKSFLDSAINGGGVTREELLAALAPASNGNPAGGAIGTQPQLGAPPTTPAGALPTAGTFATQQQGAIPGVTLPVPTNGQLGIEQVVAYAQAAAQQSQANQALQQQMATLQKSYIEQMAVAFADNLIMVKHTAMPNERDAIIAAYRQNAWDDFNHPAQVTFGQGVQGTRIDALTFQYAVRTPHGFDKEFVQDGDAQGATGAGGALFNKTTTPGADKATGNGNSSTGTGNQDTPPTPDTIANLLKLTPLGNATLEAKAKKPA